MVDRNIDRVLNPTSFAIPGQARPPPGRLGGTPLATAGAEEGTMVKIGYKLSSEEQTPRDLVQNARMAEESGFSFAMISDHFHPWVDAQGQSPFVWSVIG